MNRLKALAANFNSDPEHVSEDEKNEIRSPLILRRLLLRSATAPGAKIPPPEKRWTAELCAGGQ